MEISRGARRAQTELVAVSVARKDETSHKRIKLWRLTWRLGPRETFATPY